jgi:L-lactate dehydrogenase complex protein LldE
LVLTFRLRPSIIARRESMKVTLFIPCFVDLMYPRVGVSMVKILERLGHDIKCPEELACCGQPPFNSGHWDEARSVAGKVVERLKDAEVVVVASGSCGAMLKVFCPELFAGRPEEQAARQLAAKCFEFSDFLVTKLGITDLGAKFPARVTFHDGCHGLRELGNKMPPRQLLGKVQGLELIEMKDAEVCCGFGGTFATKFPMISTAMGEVKCASAFETGADYIVSSDSSCLMHVQGLLDRQGSHVKTIHLAEVLVQT